MLRSERRKLVKQWRKEQPKKYELYKMMRMSYSDDKKKERYSKVESVEFINTLNEEEAQEIINKTLENE